MNEQVNANEVINFLQQELTSKNLEVAILKAQLTDAKAELAKKNQVTKPAEKKATAESEAKSEDAEPQMPAQIDNGSED